MDIAAVPDREVLVLTKIIRLSGDALAKARNAALRLEAHAYEVSKDVYAHTSPSRRIAHP